MTQVLEIQLPLPVTEVSVVDANDEAADKPAVDEQALERLREQMEKSLAQDKEALSAAAAALRQGAEGLKEIQQQVVAEAERQLVDLAVDIARKVLAQEIKSEGYLIDPIVAEALAQAPTRKSVTVRLNPADLARCESAGEAADGDGEVRFVADASVPPAGCVVETEEGIVESEPRQRLDEVADALKEPEQP